MKKNISYLIYKIKLKILCKLNIIKKPSSILNNFFSSKFKKKIIQVGANDGKSGDPLYNFFLKKNNYTAILFEPLPYYFNKLKKIYSGRKDIKIIKRFITHNNSKKKLFFYIPNKNIKLMNGNGPFNDWAGGQGSFSKKFIINEIYKNNFRGNKYNINIQKFINEISSLTVPCDRISKYKISKLEISLLALDVQGYEYYILKSINFKKQKFSIIYLEDEDPQSIISTKMRRLLKINSYKLIGHEGPDYVYSSVQ